MRRLWLTVLTVCIVLVVAAGAYLGYVWIVVGGETARREAVDLTYTPAPPTDVENLLLTASLVAVVLGTIVGAVAAGQLVPPRQWGPREISWVGMNAMPSGPGHPPWRQPRTGRRVVVDAVLEVQLLSPWCRTRRRASQR